MSSVLLTDAAGRARPVTMAGEQLLPVLTPLVPLFPGGGLRRGITVVVKPAVGAGAVGAVGAGAAGAAGGAGAGAGAAGAGVTSLWLAVAAAASQAGSWCAAVGMPELGVVAAAGLGVALERFTLVPRPGEQWAAIMAALIDAVDLILIQPPRGIRSSEVRRLTSRARERGVVLVVRGLQARAWPEVPDLSLSVSPSARAAWQGLGRGHGYLQARSIEVSSTGRGAASRERRVHLWLPGAGGELGKREKRAQVDTEVEAAAAAAG